MKHPATVGSICSSSNVLARRLLEEVSSGEDGLVVDLGAGSGAVSSAMLCSGIARERIVAVEVLPEFVESFAARCPGARLVITDARYLKAALDREVPGKKVTAIVSSLPFRALGPKMTRDILRETGEVLRERGGIFIQYTYAWWLRYPLRHHGLAPGSASIVWRNLPPAKVESYKSAISPGTAKTCKKRTVVGRFLALAAAMAGILGSAVLRTGLGAITGAVYSFSAIKFCWHGLHGKFMQ